MADLSDPLSQMHLLLREHGWEPQEEHNSWAWTREGYRPIVTTRLCIHPSCPPEAMESPTWKEAGVGRRAEDEHNVEALRKRLQKLG